jgi:hypothetical protein
MTSPELIAALHVIFSGLLTSLAAVAPVFATLFVAAFLDLLSGAFSAYQSGTFDGKFLPAWIGSHSTKVMRITLILTAAVAVGGIDNIVGTGLVALGGTEAALYLAAVVSSIKGNVDDARAGTKGAPSFGGQSVGLTVLNAPSNDPIDET